MSMNGDSCLPDSGKPLFLSLFNHENLYWVHGVLLDSSKYFQTSQKQANMWILNEKLGIRDFDWMINSIEEKFKEKGCNAGDDVSIWKYLYGFSFGIRKSLLDDLIEFSKVNWTGAWENIMTQYFS
jgi:hypothetical protein